MHRDRVEQPTGASRGGATGKSAKIASPSAPERRQTVRSRRYSAAAEVEEKESADDQHAANDPDMFMALTASTSVCSPRTRP